MVVDSVQESIANDDEDDQSGQDGEGLDVGRRSVAPRKEAIERLVTERLTHRLVSQ